MVPNLPYRDLEKMARNYLYMWVFLLLVFVVALVIDGIGGDILAVFAFIGASFIGALFGTVLTALYPGGMK